MEEQNSNLDEVTTSTRLNNILIGVLLVVVVFLAYNFFQARPTETNTTVDEAPEQVLSETADEAVGNDVVDSNSENQDVVNETDLAENEYLVKRGDSLWKIAERELSDGFLWTEIARLNGIDPTKANQLEVGDVLELPQVASASDFRQDQATEDAAEPSPTDEETSEQTVSDQIYIVKPGDTLWQIAEQFYGDGHRWTEIFNLEVNNLSYYTARDGHRYPMIHTGNVLVIPNVVVET